MNLNNLSTIITLIIALAVATERLVEIIKGMWPWLNEEKTEARAEARRRAALQFLAMGGGIAVSALAWPVTKDAVPAGNSYSTVLALGLLASGGSGFWNTMLTYAGKLKDLKEAEAVDAKRRQERDRPIAHPGEGVLRP